MINPMTLVAHGLSARIQIRQLTDMRSDRVYVTDQLCVLLLMFAKSESLCQAVHGFVVGAELVMMIYHSTRPASPLFISLLHLRPVVIQHTFCDTFISPCVASASRVDDAGYILKALSAAKRQSAVQLQLQVPLSI